MPLNSFSRLIRSTSVVKRYSRQYLQAPSYLVHWIQVIDRGRREQNHHRLIIETLVIANVGQILEKVITTVLKWIAIMLVNRYSQHLFSPKRYLSSMIVRCTFGINSIGSPWYLPLTPKLPHIPRYAVVSIQNHYTSKALSCLMEV